MRCNVVMFKPDLPWLSNLRAYDDVAHMVHAGLTQAGHDAVLSINSLVVDADRYFLFGTQAMPLATVQQFPEGSIAFNFEQLYDLGASDPAHLAPNSRHIFEHFQLVDYAPLNAVFWHAVKPRRPVQYLPLPCADIPPPAPEEAVTEDIDVLYYGSLGGERKMEFLRAAMGNRRVRPRTVLLNHTFGAERDAYIRRAKIVLSVTAGRIFPEVRVSHLLAHRKAVVSDIGPDDEIDPFYRDHLVFARPDEVEAQIHALLSDEALRKDYAQRCHEHMKTRTLQAYIQALLDGPPHEPPAAPRQVESALEES